jgi:Spy/CpxP family protein refolding chaperone
MVKRISLMAVAVALFVGTAIPATANAKSGTTQPTANLAPGGKLKAALAQLDLSTVQKSKIEQIFTEFKDKAKGGTASTQPAAKGLVKKIMAVLTTEQKTKLKAMLKTAKTKQG